MVLKNLDNYFLIFTVVVGIFAILLMWSYLYETARGIYVTDLRIFKKYVNYSYAFSLIMLAVLWLTTEGMDPKIINCFWGLSIAWSFTALASLVISVFVKSSSENKNKMRLVIVPCIAKVIVMVTVVWLIY